MLARQEVLDARLQAEAKTRERLEVEMERLQMNERSGMRATNECKRLEGILSELKNENNKVYQEASHYRREFEEARESGASELKRLRLAMQTEIDLANHQVNVMREELEEQNTKLRSELDNVKMEADTVKAQNEMLLEEAQNTKASELEVTQRRHQSEVEDIRARADRQLTNAQEDGQKIEQHLLERLSISSSKIEHLQDRILHLEDRLEISKQAAAAAADAAKAAGVEAGMASNAAKAQTSGGKENDLPEKISPQALRESIMVLQEQLQAREQRIEELEQIVAKSDPDAPTKISKRDDEISWLRELLAVRHSDLQDIITALASTHYDRHVVKDAVIRLKANLQMEEQERERAVNGGSAIQLPSLAQSISSSPRVAQTIGPIAAAWGNWRKGSTSSLRSVPGGMISPGASSSTPSKRGLASRSNRLGGLMTPPASGFRHTSLGDQRSQPTAFASTGRRYTAQGSSASERPRGGSSSSRRPSDIGRRTSTSSTKIEKLPLTEESLPLRAEEVVDEEDEQDEEQGGPEIPMTPPISSNSYDSDAQPGDFDDHDFFDDDE